MQFLQKIVKRASSGTALLCYTKRWINKETFEEKGSFAGKGVAICRSTELVTACLTRSQEHLFLLSSANLKFIQLRLGRSKKTAFLRRSSSATQGDLPGMREQLPKMGLLQSFCLEVQIGSSSRDERYGRRTRSLLWVCSNPHLDRWLWSRVRHCLLKWR